MLIDFEVENFRSFRERKKLSLVASASKALPNNLIPLPELDLSLVKSAAVYGANASGKSNLLAAMSFLSAQIGTSFQRPLFSESAPQHFALDRDSALRPTHITTSFLVDRIVYEYRIAFLSGVVSEESLNVYPRGRPQEWFHREENKYEFNQTYLKGRKQSLSELTAHHVPFMAVAAALEHPQLAKPAKWIARNLRNRLEFLDYQHPYMHPLHIHVHEQTARKFREDETFKKWAIAFLRHADLGIEGVESVVHKVKRPKSLKRKKEASIEPVGDEQTEELEEIDDIFFIHSGDRGYKARFGYLDQSIGTLRIFSMLAPLYEVLEYGEVAVVDEFSANLHPMMTRELVRLFHAPELNAKGAQLIFATHDASLLSGSIFRRDQVWLTEKNASGATDLYSLHDIKDVRDEDPFDKGYLRGRYGAIPFLGEYDFRPKSIASESTSDEETRTRPEKKISPARSGKGAKKIDSHRS